MLDVDGNELRVGDWCVHKDREAVAPRPDHAWNPSTANDVGVPVCMSWYFGDHPRQVVALCGETGVHFAQRYRAEIPSYHRLVLRKVDR